MAALFNPIWETISFAGYYLAAAAGVAVIIGGIAAIIGVARLLR